LYSSLFISLSQGCPNLSLYTYIEKTVRSITQAIRPGSFRPPSP